MIYQDSLAQVAAAKNDTVVAARYQLKKKALEDRFMEFLVRLDSAAGAQNALRDKIQRALKKN